MNKKELKIDLSTLPSDAQRELYDFFTFLKQKYKNKGKLHKNKFEYLDKPLILKYLKILSREKIHERK